MAVAFDAASESERTGTTDPHTWTHTPVGAPKGVLVAVVHGTSSTDHVSGVTYGGVALSRVVRAIDAATELGAAELWFRGTGLPTGPQTVSVDLASATTDDLHCVAVTVTGAVDTEIVDFDSLEGDRANPSVTLQYGGRTCLAVAALYGGGAAPTSFTPNGNCTTVHDFDLGAFYSEVIRQTTPGSADFAIGGTSSSDDVAYVAAAVAEVETAEDFPQAISVSGSGTAAVGRAVAYLRSISVAGAGTMDMARGVGVSRSITVTGAGTAAFADTLGFARSISATGAGTASVSRALAFVELVQVTGAGLAAVIKNVGKRIAILGAGLVSIGGETSGSPSARRIPPFRSRGGGRTARRR